MRSRLPFGYLSNSSTDTVSVLDTATDPIVSSPFGVAFPIGEPKA